MQKFGLIGQKLNHSFSKSFFNKKFVDENINAKYYNFEIENISQLKNIFQKEVISGMNVTIPYKKSVIGQLDSLDEISNKIKAVNTILPTYHNNKLIHLKGFNTDAYGFHQMIKPYLKSHHEKALIFGTGGASAAVSYVLKNYNIDINYVSRTKHSKNNNTFSWSEINKYFIESHLLLINTTPIGMFPNCNQEIKIPYNYLTQNHLVIDLIYNPIETLFLKQASENNAKVLNGYQMLINQAMKAWNIWNK